MNWMLRVVSYIEKNPGSYRKVTSRYMICAAGERYSRALRIYVQVVIESNKWRDNLIKLKLQKASC